MLYRQRVLLLLFLLAGITFLDRICIAVAGPAIQTDFDLTPRQWGFVVGAFSLGYALFEIPAGMMADAFGARRMLTRLVLWWSLFTVLTGAVPFLAGMIGVLSSFSMLLMVRFLFGAGEAGAFPGATSVLSRWFPSGERGYAQGIVLMASRLGGMITPLLVVPLQKRWGWEASFYVFGVVGMIWCAIWFWRYRDNPAEKKGITAQELAEIGAGSRAPAHRPLAWRVALSKPNFWRLIVMYHAYCWCAVFYVAWLPTYLQKGRGFTPDQMKIWSMLPFALGAVAILLGGWMTDRLVRRWGLKTGRRVLGTAGLAVSTLCLLATVVTSNPSWAALLLALGYASSDFCVPVSWAITLDVGGRNAGAISGAMNMAGNVGAFLSSVGYGYFVEWLGSYDYALLPVAAMVGISALLFWKIDPTVPLNAEPAIDACPLGTQTV
jgi:MFS transporter, ACS family, glucarate transporter